MLVAGALGTCARTGRYAVVDQRGDASDRGFDDGHERMRVKNVSRALVRWDRIRVGVLLVIVASCVHGAPHVYGQYNDLAPKVAPAAGRAHSAPPHRPTREAGERRRVSRRAGARQQAALPDGLDAEPVRRGGVAPGRNRGRHSRAERHVAASPVSREPASRRKASAAKAATETGSPAFRATRRWALASASTSAGTC